MVAIGVNERKVLEALLTLIRDTGKWPRRRLRFSLNSITMSLGFPASGGTRMVQARKNAPGTWPDHFKPANHYLAGERAMTIANVAQGTARGMPKELCTAQEAINLPEVQEMLRKLAQYNLGIYMPHKHEEATGAFALLPDEITQVESGLEVTFRSMDEITNQPERFMPIGWFWRAGARTPLAFCRMHCETRPGDTEHYHTHTKE